MYQQKSTVATVAYFGVAYRMGGVVNAMNGARYAGNYCDKSFLMTVKE